MEREMKKIPVFMDILFEDYLTEAQVKKVVEKISVVLAGSKESLSIGLNNPKEIRLMVKDHSLVEENLATGERTIQDLSINFINISDEGGATK